MDWKKLLKSIGIALACVGLIGLVILWLFFLKKYPVVVLSATAFWILVAIIYENF